MAEPDKSADPMKMKMELKRLAREEKMRKKQLKREEKMRKKQKKQRKKEEKLRAKLAAKGISVPDKLEAKTRKPTTTMDAAVEKLPEAEIISAEADVWTPKSARKMDEIQKRIDRMDHKSVKTLRERYKERYGEDLEVPDIYETRPSIEVETAEETGELDQSIPEPITSTTSTGDELKVSTSAAKAKELKRAKKKKERVKVDRPLRLLDYRTPWYLRDKFGASSGSGKRAVLLIVDILLNIILTIILIKIIATIVYVIKDRRDEKMIQDLQGESAKPQPTS